MTRPDPGSQTPSQISPEANQGLDRWRVGFVLFGLAIVIGLFLIGRYTDFISIDALQNAIRQFADGPWGVPAIILAFCLCAFIGVPQFILIGIAVFAFGPLWGAAWSWVATLCSGTLTFGLGRLFGDATLRRLGEGRLKRFSDFVARNAFAASAIVRNVPAGPFLMVNMVFGAVGARYSHYILGMAIGIVPKIAVVAFGMQAIEAALSGHLWLAIGAAAAALLCILGGVLYARHRRRSGKNVSLAQE
ncbi:MAG: VTT domain-containing protein [Pseudomonadota bacterium]